MRDYTSKKAIILANGAFPTKKELLDELKSAKFLVVCDGAAKYLESINITPSVIIGDLDSISKNLREKYKDKLVQVEEQNSNDLSKAFFYALQYGYEEFVLLGATGKREDHTLANISLLCEYEKYCKNIVIYSDYGEFSIHRTPFRLSSYKGQQISLFCLDREIKFSSKGLKYPLENLNLRLWASATLNEALGEYFSIESNMDNDSTKSRDYIAESTNSTTPALKSKFYRKDSTQKNTNTPQMIVYKKW